jgi:hypothetical protein
LAYRVEGGIDVESNHIVAQALKTYDNGYKVDDRDQPNLQEHDRYLSSAIYYRQSSGPLQRFYFGGVYPWSELSTTDYTKGGGRTRSEAATIWSRALAPIAGATSPYPSTWIGTQLGRTGERQSRPGDHAYLSLAPEKRHWFWVETIGVYRFHETITELNNPTLVESWRSQNSPYCFGDFGIIYRF